MQIFKIIFPLCNIKFFSFLSKMHVIQLTYLHHIMTIARLSYNKGIETCSICSHNARDQKCLKNVMHHLRPMMFFRVLIMTFIFLAYDM